MRVLVIEDDFTLNKQLCEVLSENGYITLSGNSEREAEKALKEHSGSIAIALVDMRLPAKAKDLDNKESGLRLIQLMTKRYPTIVTVVFTGYGDLANAAKCMEAGAFSYCVKGGESDELLSKVRRAEAKYRREKSLRDGVSRLREEVDEVQKRLTNLIGAIQRLSDEVQEASGAHRLSPSADEVEENHGV